MEGARYCAVIPVYNHGATVGGVARSLAALGLPVILVDDGSGDATAAALRALAAAEGYELRVNPRNLGKGGAVRNGLLRAEERGFTHAVQVDADGQHDLERVEEFLGRSRARPEALVAGAPVYDASVPRARLIGRKITDFWVVLETWSRDIVDSMCGFRVYPVAPVARVLRRSLINLRMGFDIEILVRLHWKGVPMVFLPVKVLYPAGGISHFRMVKDNIGIASVHARLFFGMILRVPFLLVRAFRRKGA